MEIHAKSLCRTKPGPDLKNPPQSTELRKTMALQKDRQTFSESNLTNFILKNYTKPLWVFQIWRHAKFVQYLTPGIYSVQT